MQVDEGQGAPTPLNNQAPVNGQQVQAQTQAV